MAIDWNLKPKISVYEAFGAIMYQNRGNFGLLRHPRGAGLGRDELVSDLIRS
jgi:hypothetical protein